MLCKNPHVFPVVHGAPIPKVTGRGRKLGKGKNVDMLAAMKPGDSIWDVPKKKAMSIRFTAWREGIKIRLRKLPESKNYAIFRLK